MIFAMIRGPQIISGSGIGTAIMVSTPLILATYALTALALAGRVTVDLSIGPLIGFINVTTIQLYAAGYIQSPVAYFICALAIGVIYQFLYQKDSADGRKEKNLSFLLYFSFLHNQLTSCSPLFEVFHFSYPI